nr:PREDICTED: swi5-dependent recombination DNA repair protein 1 homolog [Megachile rotundata]
MSLKPFRNAKGVNKPFRSPFTNTPQNNNNKNNVTDTTESNTCITPVKRCASKKLSFTCTPSPKKVCLQKESNEDHIDIEKNKVLCQNDLELLKKRIHEKQESINNLKRTLSYRKKNKAEDLEVAINKWRNSCQVALKDYQYDLQQKCGQTVTISEILSSLNIDPNVVHFSTDDDTFY